MVPSHSLELLWKNYEAFENSAGTATPGAAGATSAAAAAKQFATRVLAEQRPRFQAARMAYRERKRRMEGIEPAALPVPPGRQRPPPDTVQPLERAHHHDDGHTHTHSLHTRHTLVTPDQSLRLS